MKLQMTNGTGMETETMVELLGKFGISGIITRPGFNKACRKKLDKSKQRAIFRLINIRKSDDGKK